MAKPWIEKSKTDGWLGRSQTKKKRQNREEPKPVGRPPIEEADYGITFTIIKCPQCGSKKVKCYSTRPRPEIRYYRCKECKYRFKAIGIDAE